MHTKRYKTLFGKWMQSRVGAVPHLPAIFYLRSFSTFLKLFKEECFIHNTYVLFCLWLLGGWGFVTPYQRRVGGDFKGIFWRRGGGV